MVPLKIVSNVSRFKPALNLNRVLADLNHGSNSLNSIYQFTFRLRKKEDTGAVTGLSITNNFDVLREEKIYIQYPKVF